LNIRTIDAHDVEDAVFSKDLQPGARTTADVDDASRLQPFDDQWDDRTRGPLGRVALPTEVGGVEIRRGLTKVGQAAILVPL
jgi:hypothetical protein